MYAEQLGTKLPDVGQPTVSIFDPDWLTIGTLPGLQTWVDAAQPAYQTPPNQFDIMGSDIWSKLPGTIAPSVITSSAAFGGRPCMDFRAASGGNAASPNAISIGANNEPAAQFDNAGALKSASFAAFMVMYLDATNPGTNYQTLLRYFNSGSNTGAILTVRNGGLGFSSNFAADGNGAVFSPNGAIPTTVSASNPNGRTHIIGVDYDDTKKTANLFIDSLSPVASGQVPTAAAPTTSSRFSMGAAAGVPQILVTELLIFKQSLVSNPAALNLLFTRLKARSGLS